MAQANNIGGAHALIHMLFIYYYFLAVVGSYSAGLHADLASFFLYLFYAQASLGDTMIGEVCYAAADFAVHA